MVEKQMYLLNSVVTVFTGLQIHFIVLHTMFEAVYSKLICLMASILHSYVLQYIQFHRSFSVGFSTEALPQYDLFV